LRSFREKVKGKNSLSEQLELVNQSSVDTVVSPPVHILNNLQRRKSEKKRKKKGKKK